jgi:diguanylate cyclase (GGDEF)-like protein
MFTDLFEQNLALQVRHNYHTALVMIDVDNFKLINDNYGHDIGDLVLKKMSECIKELLRTSDTFARWGGEEFIVLLKYANIDDSFNVCEKLRNEIAKLELESVGHITCSFGLTKIDNTDSLESAIKRADNALYQAKKEGKNKTILL